MNKVSCLFYCVTDPLTTLASAAIFSAPPTSTIVGGGSDLKQDLDDIQSVTKFYFHLLSILRLSML
jgi:hypothetical protein